jgi:hypothetical protein
MIHLFLAQAATPSPADTAAAITSTGILTKLGAALLLGAVGQGARVIVGLKKTSDEAKAKNTSFAALFDASQLLVSLLLGAIAGVFAALMMWDNMGSLDSRQILLALVVAGYAGADFIEGFIRSAGS